MEAIIALVFWLNIHTVSDIILASNFRCYFDPFNYLKEILQMNIHEIIHRILKGS